MAVPLSSVGRMKQFMIKRWDFSIGIFLFLLYKKLNAAVRDIYSCSFPLRLNLKSSSLLEKTANKSLVSLDVISPGLCMTCLSTAIKSYPTLNPLQHLLHSRESLSPVGSKPATISSTVSHPQSGTKSFCVSSHVKALRDL